MAPPKSVYFCSPMNDMHPIHESDWLQAASLILFFMVISILTGRIDLKGGLSGMLIALLLYAGGGYFALAALLLFFALGSAASYWGYHRKARLGLAEANRGRRSAVNAWANAGAAAFAGLGAALSPTALPEAVPFFRWMLFGSLAAALADTLASEVGNLAGSRYFDVLSGKPAPRGLDGVISAEGTAAALAGAVLMGLLFALYAQTPLAVVWIAAAGLAGCFADSLFGATLQRRGLMNNHSVNFFSTLIAGMLSGTVGVVL